MNNSSTTGSGETAVAVVLLQPARIGGKTHPVGATLTLTEAQAQSLFQSYSAERSVPAPASEDQAVLLAKPAGKRAAAKPTTATAGN